MDKPIIGVALPTRGMVCTKTMTSLINNLFGAKVGWSIKTTTDQPIPDGHMQVVDKALNIPGVTHIWMVEEDVVFADGLLEEMLKLDADVVASDYPQPFGESVIARKNGKIVMASTGCLLIKKEVFDKLKKPWFGINRNFRWDEKEGKMVIEEGQDFGYGGQEIYFSSRLYEAGIEIVETEKKCQHVKVNNVSFTATNKGCHELETVTDIVAPIQPGYDL